MTNIGPVSLDRLRRAHELMAAAVLDDETLAPIFARLDDELARAELSPVARARAVIQQMKERV